MAASSSAIASTVFGTLNGSLGSINTIIGWVEKLESFLQQCSEAGETIRDIQEMAEARRAELQQWRIDVTTKYPYQRELWGDEHVGVIRSKITTIEDLCSKFNDKFEGLFKAKNLSQVLQNAAERNASISTSQSQEAFRDGAKDNAKDTSTWQIMVFVKRLKPQAIDWLSRLKTMLAELSEIANKAYFVKHREKVSDGLTAEQLERLKRSTFLQMAVELRQASEKLFRLCLQAKEWVIQENGVLNPDKARTMLKMDLTGIKSGVDLEDIPSQKGIRLLYHLVLEWEALPEELCIEGPLLDLNQVRNPGSFIEAYKAILRNEEATIIVEMEPKVYFPSRGPHDNEAIEQRNADNTLPLPKSLAEIIHTLDVPDPENNMESFTRTQRLALAFKIVECGLFLAGTSWLSNLRSRFVRCSSIDTTTYCFTLDATKFSQKGPSRGLAIDMFRIGVCFLS